MVTVPSRVQTQVCLAPKPLLSIVLDQLSEQTWGTRAGRREGWRIRPLVRSLTRVAPVAGNWHNLIGCFPHTFIIFPEECNPKQPMCVLSWKSCKLCIIVYSSKYIVLKIKLFKISLAQHHTDGNQTLSPMPLLPAWLRHRKSGPNRA